MMIFSKPRDAKTAERGHTALNVSLTFVNSRSLNAPIKIALLFTSISLYLVTSLITTFSGCIDKAGTDAVDSIPSSEYPLTTK